ncbi:MAG: permease [Rickettsiales bacterium]|nr:permease [Rickettsiales bacterium]
MKLTKMEIFLPVAEIQINVLVILVFGLITGFIAGMFGIGGGFLATPLLIFAGIPPAIAVATSTNQIIASSTSGLLVHLRHGNVDVKMGSILVFGGFFGSAIGMIIFKNLQATGQIDVVIGIIYVIFLGLIGSTMMFGAIKDILQKKYGINLKTKRSKIAIELSQLSKKLPLKSRFSKSDMEISIIVPFILSILIGILVALMGIGGGFLMIPAMISILRMKQSVITGTSLFQIIFIACNASFLQALNNNIDIILSFIMIITSAIGSQIGSKASYKIDADNLRSFLALLILAVCFKMLFTLLAEPASIYSLELIK